MDFAPATSQMWTSSLSFESKLPVSQGGRGSLDLNNAKARPQQIWGSKNLNFLPKCWVSTTQRTLEPVEYLDSSTSLQGFGMVMSNSQRKLKSFLPKPLKIQGFSTKNPKGKPTKTKEKNKQEKKTREKNPKNQNNPRKKTPKQGKITPKIELLNEISLRISLLLPHTFYSH